VPAPGQLLTPPGAQVADLPISVKSLKDDPFRTLALYIRQSYGIVKCGGKATNKIFPQCKGGAVQARPFIEFRWANEFRKLFYSTGIYRESDQARALRAPSAPGPVRDRRPRLLSARAGGASQPPAR
jgi:hypothetical protein